MKTVNRIQNNVVPLGGRMTRQRDAILGAIVEAKGPLCVPQIHERARRAHAGIGLATIYRTLKLLQESGQIQSVMLPSGDIRFETRGQGHHEHFECRECREVFTLSSCPFTLPRDSVLEGGFVVEDHEITLYGRCPGCVGNGGGGQT